MADAGLKRRLPAEGLAPCEDADVSITPLPPFARLILRGDAGVAAAAGATLGSALPARPLATAVQDKRAALWLGPDEWLILDENADAEGLVATIAPKLRGLAHSLVDVSHRQTAISVSGRLAARVLSSGCPLDLHEAAFRPGMAARTVFHKGEIVLWRRSAEAFHVEVWRSFAPYVLEHLRQARRGAYGL